MPSLILLLWTAASYWEWVHPYLLPSPLKVLNAAWSLLIRGELLKHLGVSLKRVLCGFALTMSIAFPLSILIHFLGWLKNLLKGSLEFLRSIPPLSAIPLLILWFGIGEASKTAIIVMASFFPIFLNVLSGLENVDECWKELSDSIQLKKSDYLKNILIPSALPSILTGIQLGISYSWRALMGAEMIAAASGVGYLILDSQEMGRIDRVFVGIITLGICGIILDHFLMRMFNNWIPWKNLEEGQRW
ncbi:ABC transporter permease [Oceanispirochaeta sp. M1]|uniref:ABC transporter permease n=1 Tax=Oceanispirochaeta sp. M1 TaxID=2283433 RepID=UPI001F1E96FC|nr:ABC transporter permease [Oceanispirochaeta sp. M1]